MDARFNAKDLINVGIFTAIYFIVVFVGQEPLIHKKTLHVMSISKPNVSSLF